MTRLVWLVEVNSISVCLLLVLTIQHNNLVHTGMQIELKNIFRQPGVILIAVSPFSAFLSRAERDIGVSKQERATSHVWLEVLRDSRTLLSGVHLIFRLLDLKTRPISDMFESNIASDGLYPEHIQTDNRKVFLLSSTTRILSNELAIKVLIHNKIIPRRGFF